jgi:hypothetical protein
MEDFMTTATVSTHEISAKHIKRFEQKLSEVKQAVAALPGDDYYQGLYNIMHRPGWTTPAESIFFEALVDSMLTNAKQLAQLHQQLLAGSQAVGA